MYVTILPMTISKKVKFSVLDLAPVAVGQSISDAFKNTAELAQLAERLGFNRYWLAEHHNMDGIASAATSVLIGYVASKTSTIRVGSGGIMLPNHSPLVIAEQFGTLESLYPGRIDLGLGRAPGTDQATMRALRRDLQNQDFGEQVQELFYYFSEGSKHNKIKANPGAGLNIPIWLLGSSLFSAELAGKLGLPYSFASHFAPELLMQALNVYRVNFKASKHLQEPYVMVGVQAMAADSDEQAEFLLTSQYQRFLSLIRGQSIQLKSPVKSMNGLWSPAEEPHVKSRFASAVAGGPEKVSAQLSELVERTQANEVIITSEPYDHKARLHSFELLAKILS
jgi:luciferase family oxidoreductase group 1